MALCRRTASESCSGLPISDRRAEASARPSHQSPNMSIIIEAMMPRPGAANGVVPKNGIGIVFWIADLGSPGRSFGTAEPPEPEHEHNNRGDDAQAGRRKWRCAEERHRNRVLDCRSRIAGPKLRHGRATRART